MSATNEMTAIKWKRSERLHAARIVLHEMSNEMSMNVSWNANDLWNEWYSVELTQLKELKQPVEGDHTKWSMSERGTTGRRLNELINSALIHWTKAVKGGCN